MEEEFIIAKDVMLNQFNSLVSKYRGLETLGNLCKYIEENITWVSPPAEVRYETWKLNKYFKEQGWKQLACNNPYIIFEPRLEIPKLGKCKFYVSPDEKQLITFSCSVIQYKILDEYDLSKDIIKNLMHEKFLHPTSEYRLTYNNESFWVSLRNEHLIENLDIFLKDMAEIISNYEEDNLRCEKKVNLIANALYNSFQETIESFCKCGEETVKSDCVDLLASSIKNGTASEISIGHYDDSSGYKTWKPWTTFKIRFKNINLNDDNVTEVITHIGDKFKEWFPVAYDLFLSSSAWLSI